MLVREMSINFFSAVEKYSTQQDTLIQQITPQVDQNAVSISDTSNRNTIDISAVKKMDIQTIDSILRRSEERERQINLETQKDSIVVRPIYRRKIDTTELLYKQFGIAGFPIKSKLENDAFNENVLYNFSSVKPKERPVDQVFSYTEDNAPVQTIESNKDLIEPEYISNKIQFDWITIVLIASFFLLGWVRLFNKKYLALMVKSITNYNESVNLYREKNSLMERASFIINILFISNVSLFVMQIMHYFGVQVPGIEKHMLYIFLCSSFIGLYVLRAFSSWLIGSIFLKQKIFSVYFHNVNIYTKTSGLLLFPLIVALQFIAYEYLGFIIYFGIIIVDILYLFQILRAFQIIIRNNVSIFYMILYLCAFEIAPFLIIYKLLLSQG
jgi:hypothetical protein